jgi:hypothetical protein
MTKKISELTEDTTPALTDYVETAKDLLGTPLSRRTSFQKILDLFIPQTSNGWIPYSSTWTFYNRSQAYTNDPAASTSAAQNITLNMANTADFVVGSNVRVSSSAGSEDTYVTAVVANTSITVNQLLLNHTTSSPLVTLLDVFTISGDVTATIQKRAKLKWTQTTVKYGEVYSSTHVAGTTYVVMLHNTDYEVTNAAISSTYYSYLGDPAGWPGSFNFDGEPFGFSTYPPTKTMKYKTVGNMMILTLSYAGASVSDATTFTSSSPAPCVTPVSSINTLCTDNGVSVTAISRSTQTPAASRQIIHRTDLLTGAWTAANAKQVATLMIVEW